MPAITLPGEVGAHLASPPVGDGPWPGVVALDGACPVVASYGGKDKTLRGTAAKLEGGLERAGVEHDVREYPDAGHSFLNRHDLGPGGALLRVAGVGYHGRSAEAAWARILRYFETHLR